MKELKSPNKTNYLDQLTVFMGRCFSLVVECTQNPDGQRIRLFNAFSEKEQTITPDVFRALMEMYDETKDTDYLAEGAMMFYLLYRKNRIDNKKIVMNRNII